MRRPQALSENSIGLRAALFLSYSTLLSQQELHEGNRVVRLASSGSIDDETKIACFTVSARRKNCSLSGLRRSFQLEP
ncbi:MAG: hypothetical protein IIC50_18605 [Planctomycetes bacterium]|nr:hypothetical protein [Planctomycetota bacterium]